jgi:hypothetical protein
LIIGNLSVFAIESSITQAYERLSFRALGFFVIYVGGRCYGRRSPDSTMLACSYDEVKRRIAERRSHSTPFATESDAGQIADAFRDAIYAEKQQERHFGMPLPDFVRVIHSKRIMWAPDGDEAFDDGSYVLQFDVGDRVRLIAFKSTKENLHDPATLSDVWLPADDFYRVLQGWHDAFVAEWASMPKISGADGARGNTTE